MLPFFLGQLFRFENHNKFLDCSRERKGHLVRVILDHWSSRVLSNVKSFIQREPDSDRSGNSSFRNLFPIDEQDAGSTFPVPAAVIPETKAQGVTPCRQRFGGSNAELVFGLIRECIYELRLAVFHQKRPASMAASDGRHDPTGAFIV